MSLMRPLRALPRRSRVRTWRSSAGLRSLSRALICGGGELVVGGDRPPGGHAGAAPEPVGLGEGGIGRIACRPGGTAGLGGRAASRRSGAGLDFALGLVEQALELLDELVGVAPAAVEEAGDELIGVVAGHATTLDGVVDDVLKALAREGHAVLECVAEGLDALVGPTALAALPAPLELLVLRLVVERFALEREPLELFDFEPEREPPDLVAIKTPLTVSRRHLRAGWRSGMTIP